MDEAKQRIMIQEIMEIKREVVVILFLLLNLRRLFSLVGAERVRPTTIAFKKKAWSELPNNKFSLSYIDWRKTK